MRIRLFCDIEVPDQEGPMGDPKDWNWHRFLNLGKNEQIWVFGAEVQNPIEEVKNDRV